MRIIFKASFLAIWFALLAGCASVMSPSSQPEETALAWIAPDYQGEVLQLLQGRQVTSEGENLFSFQARLAIDDTHLEMIILDSFGQRLASLHWSETGLMVEKSPYFPKDLSATYILQDMVSAYWPSESLLQVIPNSMILQEDDNKRQVLLASTGQVIISYQSDRKRAWGEKTILKNNDLGYELTILSQILEQQKNSGTGQ